MKGSSFKIPYGERDGKLIHVSTVERGLKCNCHCPVCSEKLVAKKGEKMQHHFAHYADGEGRMLDNLTEEEILYVDNLGYYSKFKIVVL